MCRKSSNSTNNVTGTVVPTTSSSLPPPHPQRSTDISFLPPTQTTTTITTLSIDPDIPLNLMKPPASPSDEPPRPPPRHHLLIFRTASGSECALPPSWPDKPRPTTFEQSKQTKKKLSILTTASDMPVPPPGPTPLQQQTQHFYHGSGSAISENEDNQTLYSHASAIDIDDVDIINKSSSMRSTDSGNSTRRASISKTTITTTTLTTTMTHHLLMKASGKSCLHTKEKPKTSTMLLAADALIKGALAYSAEAHAKFARRISTKIWSRLFTEQELRVLFALVRVAGAGLTHMPDEAHCNIPWLSAGIFPSYSNTSSSFRSSVESNDNLVHVNENKSLFYNNKFVPKILLPQESEEVVQSVIFGEQKQDNKVQVNNNMLNRDTSPHITEANYINDKKSRYRIMDCVYSPQVNPLRQQQTKSSSSPCTSSSTSSTAAISRSSSNARNVDPSPPPSVTFSLPLTLPLSISTLETSQIPLSFAATLAVTVATLVRLGCTLRIRGCSNLQQTDSHVSLRVRAGGRNCGGGRRFSFIVSFKGNAPCTIIFQRPRLFGVVTGGGKVGFKSVVAEVESVLTEFVDRICGRRVNGSRLVICVR